MNSLSRALILTIVVFGSGHFSLLVGQRKSPPKPTRRVVTVDSYGDPSSTFALPPDVQRRVLSFEKVWETIRDNYFDASFNNLDWNAIKSEYAPKVRALKTDADLHRLLGEMIRRLERSHLAIIPPEVYSEIEKARTTAKLKERARRSQNLQGSGGDGSEDSIEEPLDVDGPLAQYGTGIHLRIIDGKFVIARMDKNSSAEYSGLKTGYVIDSINDVSLSTLLMRLQIYYPDARIRRFLPYQVVAYFLNGEKDSQVKIGYFDEKDASQDITLRRELIRSETVSLGSNFPDAQLRFEAFAISPDVGFVRFDHFALPVIGKLCDALTEFKDKKALVIDLRGNLGGSIAGLIGLGGMLSAWDLELGTSIYRSGPERLSSQTKAKHFKGRMVLLVDGMTVSAAEMLSAALQDSRRAFVVGERTAGETLPAITVELPTGARLLYPIANYKSASGKLLEGNGVIPDQVVALDRASLLEGRDVQVEAALRLLKDDAAFSKLQASGDTLAGFGGPPPEYRGPVNSGGAAPPPPPPMRKLPKVLAEVTVKAPAALPAKPKARDSRAVKVIDEFLALAGPLETLSAIKSYSMIGKLELSLKGVKQSFDYKVFRELPNKYVEISNSIVTGEVRSINDGNSMRVQTEFGVDRKFPNPPGLTAESEYFLPAARVKEISAYPSINYLGIFDRKGRKIHVIEAESTTGTSIALGFDVETKMISSLASTFFTLGYGDFRRVGDILLPFHVENGSATSIHLSEIKLNTPIEPSVFQPKEHCFDKP